MKNLRRNFERFCYRHRDRGIRNLMLYIAIGTAVMYLFMNIDPSQLLYGLLRFDADQILHGQVWRLFSYIIISSGSGVFFLAISLFFYYYIGKTIENNWGVFRFNLFYLCGVILTDLGALLLRVNASAGALNLSLVLAFATLYPENRVLLFFIIPLKMKYLAWVYFILTAIEVSFGSFLPLFALANYFLFFGADVLQILPDFLHPRQSSSKKAKPNASWADGYQRKASPPPYRHKCTVCGKTDVEYPSMEFRYCSKCSGYYCYCSEHIQNHVHIQ